MAGLFDEASVVHLMYNSKQMASCVSDQDRGLQVFIAACMQRFVLVSRAPLKPMLLICACVNVVFSVIAAVLCYV